jgi:hypothetical protein
METRITSLSESITAKIYQRDSGITWADRYYVEIEDLDDGSKIYLEYQELYKLEKAVDHFMKEFSDGKGQ